MGRGILLIVLASYISLSKTGASEQETALANQETVSSYQEQVLAREIAHSALNLVVARTSTNFSTYRQTVADASFSGGTYSFAATGDAAGPVVLTAFGQIGSSDHLITAVLEQTSDPLLDAITLDGPFSSVRSSGSRFLISGIDEDAPSSGGSGSLNVDGHAIRTTVDTVPAQFLSEISGDQLVGIQGLGDVVHGDVNLDLDALQDSVMNHPDLTVLNGNQRFQGNSTYGSLEEPVVMQINGDVRISGGVTGAGILLIDGDLWITGSLEWEGIVMVVSEGGDVDLRGTVDLYGALIMRSLTDEGESGGHADAGLPDGHIDVSVFDSTNAPIYQEHQYDDHYNLTSIDLLAEGCGTGGGLCWTEQVDSSSVASIRIQSLGHADALGTFEIVSTGLTATGDISDGFDVTIPTADLTTFRLDFSEVCDLGGSAPSTVAADESSRDGVLTVRVTDADGASSWYHDVSMYRHSSDQSCNRQDSGAVDVEGQSFYINGNVNIHRSTEALSSLSSLFTMLTPEPGEITLRDIRHRTASSAEQESL